MDRQIIVYKSSDGSELPVKTDGETVWLTQEQMCKLFARTQPVIARHIANIFKEGELEKEVVYAKFAYTTRHGAIAGKTQVKEVGLYRRVGFTAEGLLCVCDRHLWRELCVCRERRWVGRLKDQLNE